MDRFSEEFHILAGEVHRNAVRKGFWQEGKAHRNKAEMIALMHEELSEALGALRNGDDIDEKIPEFLEIELELADVIIRIMDFSYAFDYRVGEALEAKMEYNKSREYKHGKRF